MGILSSDKQLSSARGKGRCQPGQLLIFANIFHLSSLAPSTLPRQQMDGSMKRHWGRGFSTSRLLWASFLTFLLVEQVGGFECSVGQQQRILDSVVECSTSPVMLDLRHLILASNSSLGVPVEEVVQVVPDTVAVSRCKGGCNLPAHSCHPTQVVERQVEVMLVLARWPHGEHQVVCSSIQVEDHLACGCGCEVKPDHCSQRHYYQETTCRCLCRHTEERAVCIESGRTWDHNTCTCTCPRHTWTSCSTGYVFDYSSSCSCVLISALASQGLLPALILLTLALMAFLGGGLVLIHRARRRDVRILARTPLMSQVSKVEFEMKEESREREDAAFLQKGILPRYSRETRTEEAQNTSELLETRIHQSICRLRSHPNLLSENVQRKETANRNRHFSNI